MSAERKIYRLFVICIFLSIMSFIIPYFTASPNGGFAAATTAALSFLLSLGISLAVSMYMLIFTLGNSNSISKTARLVGTIPSAILAIILIVLIIL